MKRIMILCLAMMMWSAVAFAGININTASVQQLDTLPHIGMAKAQAIVDYRKAHGPFKLKSDLTHVKGIGNKILTKIQDQIEI